VTLLVMAACAWGSDDWREFRSSEGGKSFVGQVVGYDPAKRVVTVRMKEGGGQVEVAVEKLSAADRKFVEEEGQRLAAARFLRVRFDKTQEKSGESTKNSDTAKTTTTKYAAGYRIAVENFAPHPLKDITVEYLLVWKKDSLHGGAGNEKGEKGTKKIPLVANGTTATVTTETVTLEAIDQQGKTVRNRNKSGSNKGKTTTRTHPDARARDTLVGCVVWIKVGGQTVKTEASSPALLGRFGKSGSR
jgi:hypothetical protein